MIDSFLNYCVTASCFLLYSFFSLTALGENFLNNESTLREGVKLFHTLPTSQSAFVPSSDTLIPAKLHCYIKGAGTHLCIPNNTCSCLKHILRISKGRRSLWKTFCFSSDIEVYLWSINMEEIRAYNDPALDWLKETKAD